MKKTRSIKNTTKRTLLVRSVWPYIKRSSVFKCRWKTVSDGDDVTSYGRPFHTQAARSTIVECKVLGKTSALVDAVHSSRRNSNSNNSNLSSSAWYVWACPCWQRYTSTVVSTDMLRHAQTLVPRTETKYVLDREAIASHVIVQSRDPKTSRAATFWIDSSDTTSVFENNRTIRPVVYSGNTNWT